MQTSSGSNCPFFLFAVQLDKGSVVVVFYQYYIEICTPILRSLLC